MNELENTTLYRRTVGKKTWVKVFNFPMTEEEVDKWINEFKSRKSYQDQEFKKSKSTHGKSNNY